MASGERTIAPIPKEDDDTVHTIWKVSIQDNPKYFGESMHLIVTAWLQTALMSTEINKYKEKQNKTNKPEINTRHKRPPILNNIPPHLFRINFVCTSVQFVMRHH